VNGQRSAVIQRNSPVQLAGAEANRWEPYMFRGWRGPMDLEPGLVKWLHLAGGYGHLRYRFLEWQPTPADRAVRVNIERADPAAA